MELALKLSRSCWSLLVTVLLALALQVMAQSDFACSGEMCGLLPTSVVFTFDANQTTLCPTILSVPYVLQPAQPRLGGTFTVQGNIGPFTFECSCVAGPPNSDALIVVGSTNETGSLQIQYTAEGVPPVNVSFDYKPPGIYFNGDPSSLVITTTDNTLEFEYRPTSLPSNQPPDIAVCEVTDNGVEISQELTTIDILDNNDSCLKSSEGDTAFEIRVTLVGTPPSGVRAILLTTGSCGMMDGFMSARFNVTINTGVDPPTPTSEVTEVVTTEEGTTDPGDGGGGSQLAAIIGGCVGGGLLTIIVIVVIAVIAGCVCYRRSKTPTGTSVVDARRLDGKNTARDELQLGPAPGEVKTPDSDTVKSKTTEGKGQTERYVTIRTITKQLPPTDTVSGVAFVSAGTSSSYQQLEEELLTRHACPRVQPVATSSPTHTPTLDDYWRRIAGLLKGGKSLVYIIWSGSLETVNGSHHPPIKKVVRSLTHQHLKKDSHSVMHRLILVQLGSKGTETQITRENDVTYVFWDKSAEEGDFDVSKCADHVCGVVKDRLKPVTFRSGRDGNKAVLEQDYPDSSGVKFSVSPPSPSSYEKLEYTNNHEGKVSDKSYVTKQDLHQIKSEIIRSIESNHLVTQDQVGDVKEVVEYTARQQDERDLN